MAYILRCIDKPVASALCTWMRGQEDGAMYSSAHRLTALALTSWPWHTLLH